MEAQLKKLSSGTLCERDRIMVIFVSKITNLIKVRGRDKGCALWISQKKMWPMGKLLFPTREINQFHSSDYIFDVFKVKKNETKLKRVAVGIVSV